MARVKMLRDTPHPELGMLKEGEVVKVSRDYLRDWEVAGIAEESDDDLTPRDDIKVCDKCGQVLPDGNSG